MPAVTAATAARAGDNPDGEGREEATERHEEATDEQDNERQNNAREKEVARERDERERERERIKKEEERRTELKETTSAQRVLGKQRLQASTRQACKPEENTAASPEKTRLQALRWWQPQRSTARLYLGPQAATRRSLVQFQPQAGVPQAPIHRITASEVDDKEYSQAARLVSEAWCPTQLLPGHPSLRFSETLEYCRTSLDPVTYSSPVTEHVPVLESPS